MTNSNRLTPAEQELMDASRRYIVAKETPGVSSERLYHRLRRAVRAVKQEQTENA